MLRFKYQGETHNIYYIMADATPYNAHSVFENMVYVQEVACLDSEDMGPYLMEKHRLSIINNIELYLYY
jgi:hypothetical protein